MATETHIFANVRITDEAIAQFRRDVEISLEEAHERLRAVMVVTLGRQHDHHVSSWTVHLIDEMDRVGFPEVTHRRRRVRRRIERSYQRLACAPKRDWWGRGD